MQEFKVSQTGLNSKENTQVAENSENRKCLDILKLEMPYHLYLANKQA